MASVSPWWNVLYTRPAARASSESAVSGRAPMWPITSAAQRLASRPLAARPRPRVMAVEKSRRVEIAGSGRVHHAARPARVDHMHLVPAQDDRALFAARETGDFAMAAHRLERRIEIRGLVERGDLVLVGEEDVDMVRHQLAELAAVTAHAERIGERAAPLRASSRGRYRRLCGRPPWRAADRRDSLRDR